MPGVGAAVAIAQEAVRAQVIVVWPGFALDHRLGHDAEGHLGQDRRLEDALRPQEGYALAIELKSPLEDRERQHLAVQPCLLPQELEGPGPHARVDILRHAAYPRYTVSACHSRNSRLGWSSSGPGNEIRLPDSG